jgi:hypothetical protein
MEVSDGYWLPHTSSIDFCEFFHEYIQMSMIICIVIIHTFHSFHDLLLPHSPSITNLFVHTFPYTGEANYAHLNSIVELHNTWSSIAGISLFGLIGLWKGNPTREIRYSLGYIILFLIGLGSAGLHGTLHWIFQSSDGK